MKLNAIAAAIAVVASSSAFAAIDINSNTGATQSEFALAVIAPSNINSEGVELGRNKSVVIDLGVTTGFTGTVSTTADGTDILAELTSIFGSTAGLSYSVIAVTDNAPAFSPFPPVGFKAGPGALEQGFYVSAPGPIPNIEVNSANYTAPLINARTFIGAVNGELNANGSTGEVTGGNAFYDANTFEGDLGGNYATEADFGSTVSLYRVVREFVDTANDTPDALVNAEVGFVTLDASGVTFAPVPVPAAAWLMGSALLGLVGVSRRRAA